MTRRDLLKMGLFSIPPAAGGAGFPKIYKHTSGTGEILEYPAPAGHKQMVIKRPGFIKVRYSGLDNREELLAAAKGYGALLAREIDHLNGVLYIDHRQDSVL